MKHKLIFVQAVLMAMLIALVASPFVITGSSAAGISTAQGGSPSAPLVTVGSGFTYQGQLKAGSNPANGQYDLTFKLYDALSGGTQVGSTVTMLNQTVSNGLFTVLLDFGSTPFQGQGRWMEIAVRQAGGGSYTTLSPRQPLTVAPYAASLMPGVAVSGNVATAVLSATNTLNGDGVYGSAGNHGVHGYSAGGYGVLGESVSGVGVYGSTSSAQWSGVYGYNSIGVGVSGIGIHSYGVFGQSSSSSGVSGISTDDYGVSGQSTSSSGVSGISTSSYGVSGYSGSSTGVYGGSGSGDGVYGSGSSTGVYGFGLTAGMWGECEPANCTGVQGLAETGYGVAGSTQSGYGVWGYATTGWAGYFMGNVRITGTCTGCLGTYQIDDPLDPANKYLNQAAVASSAMLSMLNGNATLDDKGEVTVTLPDWFEAANGDFRYTLTAVGAPGPNLYIADELTNGRLKIAGGKPGGKVSWEVSGVRKDPYAQAHPIQAETAKPPDEQGKYLHPQELGQPESKGIGYDHAQQVEKMESSNKQPDQPTPNKP